MRHVHATRSAATIVTTVVACACAVALAPGAAQAAPTAVNVRIEGRTQTLFEGPILTEGHAVNSYKAVHGSEAEDLAEHGCDGTNNAKNPTPGPTPTAASVDAMNVIGESNAMVGEWYPGFDDYFPEQWGSEAENAEAEGKSWGILVNNVFTNVGGCQYQLDAGDEAVWVYNAFNFRPFLALFAADAHYTAGERPLTAVAQLGEPFVVEVLAYEDDIEDSPPAHPERAGGEPFADAKVAPVPSAEKGFQKLQLASPETVTTNAEGKASITFDQPGWHRIKAGAPLHPLSKREQEEKVIPEEEAIRSNRLDVCVPAQGASGCGPNPPDDEVRLAPRYQTQPDENPSGGQQKGTETASSAGQSATNGSGPGTPQTLGVSAHHAAAKAVIASIGARRLVLRLSAAGSVTVKIARNVRSGERRRWRTVKTIKAKAAKAGTLTLKLPRLSAGSYRASIAFAAAAQLTKTFLVRRTH
jgi:hypothetical protein